MYQLVQAKKKQDLSNHDYVFEGFEPFYQIANALTVPLNGRYSIGIKSDILKDVTDFILIESKYASMLINIYIPENLLEYIVMYNSNVSVAEKYSPYDIFKELIQQKSVFFESTKLMSILYASIEHDFETMNEVLDSIINEFGINTKITESMLSTRFILNKTVYPRQVLLAYLRMERWRDKKLEACLNEMGNEVTLGALVKNIKSIFEAKVKYYQSGSADGIIKNLDARNIMLMYRILVVERSGMNDVTLLLNLYERGISSYDLIQTR